MNLSKLDDNLTVKDAKITHLSTWLVAKDPALIQELATVCSEDVLPVNVKIRYYGEEFVQKVYNNLLLEDLMTRIEQIS